MKLRGGYMRSVFASRLTKLREELGMSQNEVSKELGMSQSTYAGYEVDRSEPNFETLRKLSSYYKVSIDYLIGQSDVKATQAEVDFLNEVEEKGIDQLIREYNLTLGDKAMDPKEERILIKLIKSFMEEEKK